MLLKIIARIECMQFILAANINYVTCKLFSVAHVRDLRLGDGTNYVAGSVNSGIKTWYEMIKI